MIAKPNLPIYARGGAEVLTRSRFMKSPNVFTTDIERNNYGKAGKTGEMSKPKGDKSAALPKEARK